MPILGKEYIIAGSSDSQVLGSRSSIPTDEARGVRRRVRWNVVMECQLFRALSQCDSAIRWCGMKTEVAVGRLRFGGCGSEVVT